MNDPYSILGLKSGASITEVKKAYKILAKKYHPDVTGNDPASAKKMQEINAAYDAIINNKAYGDSSSSSYNHYYENSASNDEENIGIRAAQAYINSRRFREALNALSTVKTEDRNGRWHYLKAICEYYIGDTVSATSSIAEAMRMEPNNLEYSAFLDRMRYSGNFYRSRQTEYPQSNGFFSCCLPLVLLNLFCPGYFCIC